jgi:dTMP kinase
MKIYKNFISFEGIDFSGKTTQLEILQQRLQNADIENILVREPGGTTISEKIRDILLNPDYTEMHAITEILLYEAARAQLVHQRVLPLLEKNIHVIADRYYDSTTAYQGYGRKLNLPVVRTINNFATSSLRPYKSFFIDISAEEAENRQKAKNLNKDRLENGGFDFFQLIRSGYQEMCREEPERFIIINGEQKPEKISEEIWSHITQFWPIQV